MKLLEQFLFLLWNPRIYYRVHKSPPLDPFPGQIKPVHVLIHYFFKSYFNIILHLRQLLSHDLFLSRLLCKTVRAFHISSTLCRARMISVVTGSSAEMISLWISAFRTSVVLLLLFSEIRPRTPEFNIIPTVWIANFHTSVQQGNYSTFQ